jgi:hypothetical protein
VKVNPSAYLRRQHRALRADQEFKWKTNIWNEFSKVSGIRNQTIHHDQIILIEKEAEKQVLVDFVFDLR